MIQKLYTKGFKYNENLDCLYGVFNGSDVYLCIKTIHNKVWRIALVYARALNEADVKINFNNLCKQFSRKDNYETAKLGANYFIPEDDDIEYVMEVKNKRYEADYLQLTQNMDFDQNEKLNDLDKLLEDSSLDELEKNKAENEYYEIYHSYIKKFSKNSVWFMISKDSHENSDYDYDRPYRIVMFYDNENNHHADGEDL